MFDLMEGLSVLANRLPFYLVLAFGMYKCMLWSQSQTTHKLCVVALFTCFLGYGIVITTPILRAFASYSDFGELLGVANIALGIIVFVFAIAVGFKSLRDLKWHCGIILRGGVQAKWAVGLSIPPLVILIPLIIRIVAGFGR